MSYSWEDYALDLHYQDLEQEALEEELANAIEEAPKIRIRAYLASNGDSIQNRINSCITKAQSLLKNGDFSLSIITSVTAIEIITNYFLVIPLAEGALADNKLATVLKDRIKNHTKSNIYRQLMRVMLKVINLDIEKIQIENDKRNLWKTFAASDKKSIIFKRNRIVHHGDSASEQDAITALKCAKTFKALPEKVANVFGLSILKNTKWVENQITDINGNKILITARNPFI